VDELTALMRQFLTRRTSMYKLLRIVSIVLFVGGLLSAPFLGSYTMFFLPFVGMVGYLVATLLEKE